MSLNHNQDHLPDVAAGKDTREIHIPSVGVRKLRMPCQVICTNSAVMPTVAEFELTVSLEASDRGTHMSRLVSIVDETCQSPITLEALKQTVTQAAAALDTHSAQIKMCFPYFVRKEAPVTGSSGLLDVDIQWSVQLSSEDYSQQLMLLVPVQSVCPCSKEVSEYGAHNQRCLIQVTLDISSDAPAVNIDEIITGIEASASMPLFSALKREDERYVTESAYENPKFVEDILRDLVLFLRTLTGITGFHIDVESIESIHNHNVCASIEESLA